MNFKKLGICTIAILGLSTQVALADSVGAWGQVVSFEQYANSADAFIQQESILQIKEGDSNETMDTTPYLNGGAFCSGRVLTDNMKKTLSELVGKNRIYVVPFYKNGQAGKKCLVGFQVKKTPKYGHGNSGKIAN